MAFCANCGAALANGAAFCAGCGKPVEKSNAANTGTTPAPTLTSPAPAAAGSVAAASGLTPNVAGALAYILGFITGIIFLVLEPYKNDRFVRFHAMQSIFYSAACIVLLIAWGIVWSTLFAVTGSFSLVLAPVWTLLRLAMFVYWLYLMYQAYNNREYRIPFIGDLAAKQVG
jgi:uncharacterized membrane protein